MRRFLVLGHRARTSADYALDDLPGAGGRTDILCRAAANALFTSHAIRRDAEAWLVLLGPPSAPVTVRVRGAELRNARHDERSLGGLVLKALAVPVIGRAFVAAAPGVSARCAGLAEALADARREGLAVVVMAEDGDGVGAAGLPSAALFVLGDHEDPTPEERAILAGAGATSVSLGATSYAADQCVTLVHWLLDAGAKRGFAAQ